MSVVAQALPLPELTEEQSSVASNAIVTIAMAHRETRKLWARQSIGFFAWYYLGVKLAKFQERWLEEIIKSHRGLILAPVGHGKTEALAKVLTIYLIVHNRNIRILLLSKGEGHSEKNLAVAKHELRFNERLIADYGQFYSIRNVWKSTKITVIRDQNLKDYTIEATGLLGSITGGRFDVIIGDDIIDRLIVLEAGVRKKILEYVMSTVMTRLTPNGAAWFIGTRKHFDDIYASFMKDPTFKVIHDKAIIREPEDHEIKKLDSPILLPDGKEQTHAAVIHGDDPGECLWPEMWSMEKLLLEKFRLGSIVFAREYQDEVVDDETALFPLQKLEACRDDSMSYISGELTPELREKYKVIVLGFDPSLVTSQKKAQARDTDYFVGIGMGLRLDGFTRDLLLIVRKRGLDPDKSMNMVKAVYYQIMPDYCAAETNSFGEILHWNLVHKAAMKILSHVTGSNKNDTFAGVPCLSPLFENGMIHLPNKTEADKLLTNELIAEFHGLGVESHDDMVMGLWIAETLIQRYLAGQANIEKMKARMAAQKQEVK